MVQRTVGGSGIVCLEGGIRERLSRSVFAFPSHVETSNCGDHAGCHTGC